MRRHFTCLSRHVLKGITSANTSDGMKCTASLALTRRGYGNSSSSTDNQTKKLFTPGPLCVSDTVRQAALEDLGSRDVKFMTNVKYLRAEILKLADTSERDFTVIPLQGSGTYAVEAVIQSAVPRQNGKVLILENGAYGKRMGKICEVLNIPYHIESFPEDSKVDPSVVEKILKGDKSYTMVAVVHCETSSGVFNPVEEIGQIVKEDGSERVYFVDAMSSFGAVPLDVTNGAVDYVVSSANKCIQGIPGFSFVVARKSKLQNCQGNSRSLSLDLYDQHEQLEKTGQFRFTPPTHCMLAFCQALKELKEEGGVLGRAKRYQENREILRTGMKKLGFEEFLSPEHEGYIITSYKFPQHPNFNFTDFYNRLNAMGQVIYPGKVLNADCFRIGNIGHIFPGDMRKLLECIETVCKDMKIHTS